MPPSRRDPYLSKWMMGRGPGCERAGWGRDPNHPEETRRLCLCVLSTPSVQAPSLLEFHPTPPRKSHPQLLFFESAAFPIQPRRQFGEAPRRPPPFLQLSPNAPAQRLELRPASRPPPQFSRRRQRSALGFGSPAKRLVPLLAMSDITPTFRREPPKTLATPKFLLGKRLGHHNPLLALATVDRRTAGRS